MPNSSLSTLDEEKFRRLLMYVGYRLKCELLSQEVAIINHELPVISKELWVSLSEQEQEIACVKRELQQYHGFQE